jgi:hypothetical protein
MTGMGGCQTTSHLARRSDFRLRGDFAGVFDLDTELPHRTAQSLNSLRSDNAAGLPRPGTPPLGGVEGNGHWCLASTKAGSLGEPLMRLYLKLASSIRLANTTVDLVPGVGD